jgi:hypothetical protein
MGEMSQLLSLWETRDLGLGKVGLEPARHMWQGISRLGSKIPASAVPVAWLRAMPLHVNVWGGVGESFE